MASNQESTAFDKFETWLTTRDGGKKSVHDARQHRLCIQRVAIEISGWRNLFQRSLMNEWMSKAERKFSPGTVKTYREYVFHL